MQPGQILGHYEILEKLGEGGMGSVWKARDTRLGRTVALKALSERMFTEEGRHRLMQEARAASILQHPNIVTLHDVGSHDGIDFLVMEYVAGETLDQRLQRAGPFPPEELLRIGMALASALSHAHGHGIVHRDLKPANVIISVIGVPKLLDFGLAKRVALAGGDENTLTQGLTEDGAIMGTVSYMSPEQAEGRPLDARSDIFSLGAVLYEMATARRAFRGASRISTLSAILRDEPEPVTQIVKGTPLRLEHAIAKCLRKQPEHRYATAAELERDLSGGPMVGSKTVARPAWMIPLLAAACLLAVAAAGAFWWRSRQPPGSAAGTAAVPARALKVTPFTTMPGLETLPRFSPDGRRLAFLAENAIHVQDVATGKLLRLALADKSGGGLAWSPDGKRIATIRGGWTISVPSDRAEAEGDEHRLAPVEGETRPAVQAWSPDGATLVYNTANTAEMSNLVALTIGDRTQRQLTATRNGVGVYAASFSPDGRQLAFASRFSSIRSTVRVIPAAGGEERQVGGEFTQLSGVDWSSDGASLFASGQREGSQGIWRIEAAGTAGSPVHLMVSGQFYQLSVARVPGLRIAASQSTRESNIVRFPIQSDGSLGEPAVATGTGSTRNEQYPQYSPDGKKILFASDRGGSMQTWVTDGREARQVTSLGKRAVAARWSPDGRRLVCSVVEGEVRSIYVVDLAGSAPPRKLVENAARPAWSADGQWIYYVANLNGKDEIAKIPAEGGATVQLTRDGGFEPQESADGRFLFYLRDGALMRSGGGVPPEPIASRVANSLWAVTRDSVWYVENGRLFSYSIAARAKRDCGAVERFSAVGLSVSPDRRFVLAVMASDPEADIALIE